MKWRLIIDGNRSAALNMTVDEAIWKSCAEGLVPPTLRLYGWERPSISIGRLQKLENGNLDIQYCMQAGIEIVRRPTGGRAVVHGHDVTFSISLPESELPVGQRGIPASHRWLMGGVAAGLALLGTPAEIGPESNSHVPSQLSADCFAHVAECDIRVGSSKVVGAAQARRWSSLLEQGSIPYLPPQIEWSRVFPGSTSQGEVLPVQTTRTQIERAVVQGFIRSLGIDFTESTLTDEEIGLAQSKQTSRI